MEKQKSSMLEFEEDIHIARVLAQKRSEGELASDLEGYNALVEACAGQDIKRVRSLLRKGVNPEFSLNNPALRVAITFESLEIIELLLIYGALSDDLDEAGEGYLHNAALSKNKALLRLLLQYGAPIDQPNKNKKTALERVAVQLEEKLKITNYSESHENLVYSLRRIIVFLIVRGAFYKQKNFPRVTGYLKELLTFKPNHLRLATALGLDENVAHALSAKVSAYYKGKKQQTLTAIALAELYDRKGLVGLFHKCSKPVIP